MFHLHNYLLGYCLKKKNIEILKKRKAETTGPIHSEHAGALGYPVMSLSGTTSDGVTGLQGLLFWFSLPTVFFPFYFIIYLRVTDNKGLHIHTNVTRKYSLGLYFFKIFMEKKIILIIC